MDFFFLLKKPWISLAEVIEYAKKKFKGEFNEVLFLQQLAYFNDVEEVSITFLKDSFTRKEIQSFLEQQVEMYTKNIL